MNISRLNNYPNVKIDSETNEAPTRRFGASYVEDSHFCNSKSKKIEIVKGFLQNHKQNGQNLGFQARFLRVNGQCSARLGPFLLRRRPENSDFDFTSFETL